LKIHCNMPSHISLGLLCGLFCSGFPTKSPYTLSSTPHMPHGPSTSGFLKWSLESHLVRSTRDYDRHYATANSPITACFLGLNIFFGTLLPNTLSLRSSLNVRDQVSHPYKTTEKIKSLYILIYVYFWIANGKAKDSGPMIVGIPRV
jgi:hypothetical protein